MNSTSVLYGGSSESDSVSGEKKRERTKNTSIVL